MCKLTDCLSDVAGAAVTLCWSQWRSLLAERAPTPGRTLAMIDPEALVLASLALRSTERRLDDMLRWIAKDSGLLSVQRIKSLARWFPRSITVDLEWFASVARAAGDARWRTFAASVGEATRGRPGKSMPMLSLRVNSAFMFRVRSGLGVGIKADLVACLAGMRQMTNQHAGGLAVSDLASILTYSKNATRQALDEMVRADVVVRIEGRPTRHRLGRIDFQSPDCKAPSGVQTAIPSWGYCSQVYAILLACEELLADRAVADLPAVVQASRLRDLAEHFAPYWSWFGAEQIDDRVSSGTRYFEAFHLQVQAVLDWVGKRL